ncbi:MAG: hypothetical protein J5850_04705, partial [Clostridia bacterium]|nr:hypothetical protein [Clostridia bacterium]
MKKKTLLVLVLVIVTAFAFAVQAFAKDDPVRLVEQDGLKAELEIAADETAPELTNVTLKLTKDSDSKVAGIKAVIEFRGTMYRLNEGAMLKTSDLAAGSSEELKWVIVNRELQAQKPSESSENESSQGEEQKGGALKIIIIAAAVVVVGVLVVLITKSKNGTKAMILVGVMLLSSFAFLIPAKADEYIVTRKMELLDYISYNGKDYQVKINIEYEHKEDVKTKNMGGFDITYYYGPHGKNMTDEEFVKKIAEAGFTSIPLEENGMTYNKIALKLLAKYNMTCSALYDPRIQNLVYSINLMQEEIDEIVMEVVEDYKEFDNIKGWWITDEPGANRFDTLSKIVLAFRKYDPERTTMINLFPTYASDEQLGTQGYQEYLDRFVDEVRPHYLSYDHYHFREEGARYGFFVNLEYVRNKALESGLDPMQIILLTKHLNYVDLSYDQIEWEVNTSLTYGMKRISYFTFILEQGAIDEGCDNACMSYTGEIYPHYYDVQKISKWLLPLGTELYGKASVGVYHVKKNAEEELEERCEEYEGYGDLGAINGTNFLIGFFDDGSFMITDKYFNKNEKESNLLEFVDIASGLEYFDVETATWKDAEADGVVTRNADG